MKVKLEFFEGPLDLLLYLIRKNEVDIYNIPIAQITEQYLRYLEFMRMLDLNIASEFLSISATLIYIKSKMLLPADERIQEEPEEQDPRAELVRKLLEYKKFKEAAEKLAQMEIVRKEIFTRSPLELNFDAEEGPYFEASLFDLISAFSKALEKVPREEFFEVVKDEFTVEGKIHEILHILLVQPVIYLTSLFQKAKNRLEVVTIFLSILELIRLKEIIVRQKRLFDEIQIIRNKENIKPKLVYDTGRI